MVFPVILRKELRKSVIQVVKKLGDSGKCSIYAYLKKFHHKNRLSEVITVAVV